MSLQQYLEIGQAAPHPEKKIARMLRQRFGHALTLPKLERLARR